MAKISQNSPLPHARVVFPEEPHIAHLLISFFTRAARLWLFKTHWNTCYSIRGTLEPISETDRSLKHATEAMGCARVRGIEGNSSACPTGRWSLFLTWRDKYHFSRIFFFPTVQLSNHSHGMSGNRRWNGPYKLILWRDAERWWSTDVLQKSLLNQTHKDKKYSVVDFVPSCL